MNATAPRLPVERAAPRTRVLFALGAGVLLAHLSLLSGGLSGLSLDMFTATASDPASAPDPTGAPPPPEPTAAASEELPPPVRSSRVRWIVPKPPAPEPAPPPPPPPPPKVVEPPPPPVEAIVVEPPAEPPVEPPPPEVAMAPPEPPAPPPAEATPANPPAPVSDLPPAPEVAASTVQGAGAGMADPSLPPALPPPGADLRFSATSLSKGKTYNGSAQLEWSHDGGQYEARLTVRVLVFTLRSQSSTGQLNSKGLMPDRFTDKTRNSERAAHFDREGQRLRFSNNAPDATLLPGAQDWLSVNFQLAALFNARPDAYAEGQSLRLPVTSVTAAEIWLFRVGATTTETLPAGEVRVVKLTRSPRKEFDKKVEVWLLPAYAHLPGRIRITESNGDYVDMVLQDLPVLQAMPAPQPRQQ